MFLKSSQLRSFSRLSRLSLLNSLSFLSQLSQLNQLSQLSLLSQLSRSQLLIICNRPRLCDTELIFHNQKYA